MYMYGLSLQDKKTLAELEESATKARKRSTGNIRFIGELFRLKMLTENIMHDCIFKLLKTRDDESIECLCNLLETIGQDLDTPKAKVSFCGICSSQPTSLVFFVLVQVMANLVVLLVQVMAKWKTYEVWNESFQALKSHGIL